MNSRLLGERFGFERGFDQFRHAGEFPMRAEPSLVEPWVLEWIAARPPEPRRPQGQDMQGQ